MMTRFAGAYNLLAGTPAILHRAKLLLLEIALPPSWLRAILKAPAIRI